MADVQLIDFPKPDADQVRHELDRRLGLEVIVTSSRWRGGEADLEPDPSSRVIAFYLELDPTAAQGLHAADAIRFHARMEDALLLAFLHNCSAAQLRAMTGIETIHLKPSSSYLKPGSVRPVADVSLTLPFSRYQTSMNGQVWITSPGKEVVPLASHSGADGTGLVAAASPEAVSSGIGWVIYPTFGAKTGLALVDLVSEVLPSIRPGVFADRAHSWTDDPTLWVGRYAVARSRFATAEAQWERRKEQLQVAVERTHEKVQTPLLALLSADGDELKQAVMRALESIGFGVEDADAKELGPGPQEDFGSGRVGAAILGTMTSSSRR
jgi:hypothetical protein